MVREKPTNTHAAGIDTYHSTMFTLLLELNVTCGQRWVKFELQNIASRAFAVDGKIYTTIFLWQNIHYQPVWSFVMHDQLANQLNRITTKILVQNNHIKKKFSQSDQVLIRQFSKKLQSYPVMIRPKLASVLIQSDPVLIRAHLCKAAQYTPAIRINSDKLTYTNS